MANPHPRRIIQWRTAMACSLALTAPASAYDWLQFGGNAQHTANNTAESILTPANVSSLVSKYTATLAAALKQV